MIQDTKYKIQDTRLGGGEGVFGGLEILALWIDDNNVLVGSSRGKILETKKMTGARGGRDLKCFLEPLGKFYGSNDFAGGGERKKKVGVGKRSNERRG